MYQITRSEVEHVLATLDMMEAGLEETATLHEEHLAESRELLNAIVQGGTNGEKAGEQSESEASVEEEPEYRLENAKLVSVENEDA